jgi:hypothetical protein
MFVGYAVIVLGAASVLLGIGLALGHAMADERFDAGTNVTVGTFVVVGLAVCTAGVRMVQSTLRLPTSDPR